MNHYLPTFILRHKKENLKKCSLRGLESRDDFRFFTYPKNPLPDLKGYILLTPDSPLLSHEDTQAGLLLVDGTWRYAETMVRQIPASCLQRSIPTSFKTAYPRRQEIDCGLASIEALFIALHLMKRPTAGLLDHYHWKEKFLDINANLW
jgi:pre-rRNA-processing protein TSR3